MAVVVIKIVKENEEKIAERKQKGQSLRDTSGVSGMSVALENIGSNIADQVDCCVQIKVFCGLIMILQNSLSSELVMAGDADKKVTEQGRPQLNQSILHLQVPH